MADCITVYITHCRFHVFTHYFLFVFLLMTNLTHFLSVFIYFTCLHVSNSTVFIIRRWNVLIHHLVCIGLCGWLFGMPCQS